MPDILIRGKDLMLPERSSEILEVFVFSDGTIQYGKHYGFAIELPEHGDLISKDDTMNAILGEPPEAHYPSWYASIVNEIPAIVPSNKEETK